MIINYKKYIPIKDPNEISNIISNNKKSKLDLAIYLPGYSSPILNRFIDSDFNKYVPEYIHYIYDNHKYITELLFDAWITEACANITIKKVPKIKNIIDNIKRAYISNINKNNNKSQEFKLAEDFISLLKNNDLEYSLTYTFQNIKIYWRKVYWKKDILILDLGFVVAHSWYGAAFEFKLFMASQPDLKNYINRLKVEVLKEL